jgi:hypothetical protein
MSRLIALTAAGVVACGSAAAPPSLSLRPVEAGGVFADGVAAAHVEVRVVDAAGVGLAGQLVLFEVTGSGNVIVQPGTTDASGLATGSVASTVAEMKTVTARLGAASATATLSFVPAPARLVFQAQPQDGFAGVLAPAVTVAVLDAGGNPVEQPVAVSVTLAVRGALGGTTSADTVNGVARFDALRIDLPGTGYLLTATSGAWTATSQPFALRGFRRAQLEGGVVGDVVADPGRGALYAASDGKVYQSYEGAWTPVGADGLGEPILTLAVDGASGTLYGAGQTSVWRYAPGLWTPVATGLDNVCSDPRLWLAIAPTQPVTVWAWSPCGKLYRITGAEVEDVSAFLGDGAVSSLAVDPLAPATVYVATFGDVYRSTGGAFVALPPQGFTADFSQVVATASPHTVYGATFYHGLFRLDGDSWTPIGAQAALYEGELVLDPAHPGDFYVGSDHGSDYGVAHFDGNAWTPLAVLPDSLDSPRIAVDPADATRLYAATENGVWATSGGAWGAASAGLGVEDVRALAVGAGPVRAGVGGEVLFTAAGSTWSGTWLRGRSQITAVAVDPKDQATVYVGLDSGPILMGRGGPWTELTGDSPKAPLALVVGAEAPHGRLYAADAGNGVFVFDAERSVWTHLDDGLAGDQRSVAALAVAGDGTVYAGTYDGALRLEGTKWVALPAFGATAAGDNSVAALAAVGTPTTLYAGTLYRGVLGYDGSSWTPVGALGVAVTRLAAGAGGALYAATDGALYRYRAGWSAVATGLPAPLSVRALAADPVDPLTVYVATSAGLFASAP